MHQTLLMTYRQTLEFFFSRLPAYQRIGKAAYKGDLRNHSPSTVTSESAQEISYYSHNRDKWKGFGFSYDCFRTSGSRLQDRAVYLSSSEGFP